MRSLRDLRYFITRPHTGRGFFSQGGGTTKLPDGGVFDAEQRSTPVLAIDPTVKQVITAVGSLPLSPLMDPSFWEARDRFTKKKPTKKPISSQQRWQRKLSRNPFAKALASPIRMCSNTKAHLPRAFLQRFELARHPETDAPWWIPGDLSSAASKKAVNGNAPSSCLPYQSRKTIPTGPSGYVLARQALLAAFVTTKSPYSNGHRRLVLGPSPRLADEVRRAVWREDMADLVADLMRRRVVEQLAYLADGLGRRGSYVTRCETWEGAAENKHRGCLLWLGTEQKTPGSGNKRGEEAVEPPRLSMMDLPTSKFERRMAVHNLRVLLGEAYLAQLRNESETMKVGSLFMLARQRTLKLQWLLWKLQDYLP